MKIEAINEQTALIKLAKIAGFSSFHRKQKLWKPWRLATKN